MSEQPSPAIDLRDRSVPSDEAGPHREHSPCFTVEVGSRQQTSAATAPRIMLIEGDFIFRAHLAELLVQQGYSVTCAADGAEALRRLHTEPAPSVILVDVLLPRIDGVAFRRLQLEMPTLRDIPTIALTSVADASDDTLATFTEVIRKPVDSDRVVDLLARFCPRARSAVPTHSRDRATG